MSGNSWNGLTFSGSPVTSPPTCRSVAAWRASAGADSRKPGPTGRLLSGGAREPTRTTDRALAAIACYDIPFVVQDDPPYSGVQNVWPQIAVGQAFEPNGFRFEPVRRCPGLQVGYGARPTILWQISSLR